VPDALGEAVGVNFVRGDQVGLLKEGLKRCGPMDYFEKGVEHAIAGGLEIYPADVSDLPCVEVDFEQDLARAKSLLPSFPAVAARLGR
jgi:choline kinase